MSECPTRIIINFDYTKKYTKSAFMLWACIKYCHISDQYFNDNVISADAMLTEKDPQTYAEFIHLIDYTALNVFGTREANPDIMFCYSQVLDEKFWKGVWEYWKGDKELEIVVET